MIILAELTGMGWPEAFTIAAGMFSIAWATKG
jgi:hypothetical protein